MRTVLLMCLAAVVLTAGVANANTVWNPALNGYVAGDVVEWNEVPTNWANGTPVSTGDGTNGNDPKAVFNVADPATCRISAGNDADWGTLVMGDNGAASPQNAILEIMPGATLTLGASNSWSSIGYSRDCGTVLVHRDATIDMDCHLYLGMNSGGDGDLIIDGGTVLVADTFRYGRNAGAGGRMYLNAGLFQARYLNSAGPVDAVEDGGGLIDIAFGKYRLTGGENTDRDRLQRDIDSGHVIAFGGLANPVKAQEANGDWYVVADADPLNRVPTMDAEVNTSAALDLSWDNIAPVAPDTTVDVDVWFGTDMTWVPQPDANLPGFPGDFADWQIVASGTDLTTTQVDASTDTQQYIWRIDTTPNPGAAEPNLVEGVTIYFTAYDDLPVQSVVMEGVSMVTWAGEPISLEATITDDGGSALTVDWSAEDTSGDDAGPITDPNAVFTNELVVDNGDGTFTATADVTIDYHAAQFSVTATASDLSVGGPVSDSQQHDCAESACQATGVLGYGDGYPGDIAVDCDHTLADFAALAEDWLAAYALSAPTEIPQP